MTARNLIEAELEGNHAAGAILLEQSLVDVRSSSCLRRVVDQEANVAIIATWRGSLNFVEIGA